MIGLSSMKQFDGFLSIRHYRKSHHTDIHSARRIEEMTHQLAHEAHSRRLMKVCVTISFSVRDRSTGAGVVFYDQDRMLSVNLISQVQDLAMAMGEHGLQFDGIKRLSYWR